VTSSAVIGASESRFSAEARRPAIFRSSGLDGPGAGSSRAAAGAPGSASCFLLLLQEAVSATVSPVASVTARAERGRMAGTIPGRSGYIQSGFGSEPPAPAAGAVGVVLAASPAGLSPPAGVAPPAGVSPPAGFSPLAGVSLPVGSSPDEPPPPSPVAPVEDGVPPLPAPDVPPDASPPPLELPPPVGRVATCRRASVTATSRTIASSDSDRPSSRETVSCAAL